MKFALYNYAGQTHSYYKVEQESLPASDATGASHANAHLLLVVDRSGSMWDSMEQVKQSVEKILTSEETKNRSLLVSMISYSSAGDTTIHFKRSPIANLSQSDAPETKAIRRLQPAGLTSLSGGVEDALTLVQQGETTLISLHSDGYANDDSSYLEQQKIAKLIASTNNPNLSVHTIAHTSWSDFQTLSRIANSLSGTCVYARSTNDIEGPLLDVLKNASGPVEPPFVVNKNNADLVVFYSLQGKRILASEADLMVSGLPEGSDRTAYRFTKITQSAYKRLTSDVCGDDGVTNALPLYIFARGVLSLGNINLAKYAMISTRDKELINNHYQALVNEDLAEMASSLESLIFADSLGSRNYNDEFGFDSMDTSVLEITTVLQKYARYFQVDIHKLRQLYVRRTIDKIPGKRDADGTVIANQFETRPVETDDFVEVVECNINQNTANINLTISDSVQLYPVGANTPVTAVSGVDISNLKEYRSYTIVGDGRLNLPAIHVKISDQAAFQALKKLDVVAGRYTDTKSYEIDFRNRPLLPLLQDFASLGGVFDRLMSYRILQSVLKALLKGSSSSFTGEQIKELRTHYITPSLHVSLPSTVPYSNLDDAINKGEVERRPSYVIDIGTTTIQNKADFRSANQGLKSFYTFAESSTKPSIDPKWEHLTDNTVVLERKELSKRTKVTTADDLMMKIFDDLLGLTDGAFVANILKGLGKSKLNNHVQNFAQRQLSNPDIAALEEFRHLLQEGSEEEYVRTVSPIVFYIGATGLLPDEFEYKSMDADTVQQLYPHLKITKDEKTGTFFVFDDNLISVFVKDVLVSR